MRGSFKCSCRHTTPLQACGSSGSTVITPAIITRPNTPCGRPDVLSYPLFITPTHLSHPQTHLVGVRTSYHTPWFITPPLGPLRAALYHPGYTRYHTPHRIPHPVIIFLNPTILSPGCVVLCQLRVFPRVFTRTRNFCKFCRISIPVPGTFISSVHQCHKNPEYGYSIFIRAPGTSATSVRLCHNSRNF